MTVIIAFLLAVCLPLETSLAKKPTAEPPPVLYQIQFFDMPYAIESDTDPAIYNMNNAGCLVGEYRNADTNLNHAFVYDPTINPTQAIDLNDIVADIPPGWRIAAVGGINDPDPGSGRLFGDIVGYIAREDPYEEEACFIDMNAMALEAINLPEEFGAVVSWKRARKINSSGDIAGYFRRDDDTWGGFLFNPGYVDEYGPVEFTQPDPPFRNIGYRISINDRFYDDDLGVDVFQIAGEYYVDVEGETERYPFRWDIEILDGDPIPYIPQILDLPDRQMLGSLGLGVNRNINNAGVVLGKAVIGVGKNKSQWAIFRHDGRENPDREWIYLFSPDRNEVGVQYSINDQGDFVTSSPSRIYLDAPLGNPDGEQLGFFYLDELIDPDDPDAEAWSRRHSLRALNNRITDEDGITIEFGQIAGTITVDGARRGFVLTPSE